VEDGQVQEAIEGAGYAVRDYSGRGMYGKYCLAVESDDSPEQVLLSIVGEYTYTADNLDEVRALTEALKGCQTDTLGRGAILYWPGIEWVDTDPDEDDEDA
jgi:hypothetical protein